MRKLHKILAFLKIFFSLSKSGQKIDIFDFTNETFLYFAILKFRLFYFFLKMKNPKMKKVLKLSKSFTMCTP